MRTPGNDDALSVGFLFTEGIINDSAQVSSVSVGGAGENTTLVRLREDFIPVLNKSERNFYTTSSCGVCGKSSMDAIRTVCSFSIDDDRMVVSARILQRLPARLR